MPACHIGISINSHGPNNSLVHGDVSGPAATIEAASCIDRSIAQVMIAGATGTRISTTRLNYRGNLPIANAYDPIEHSSRPHDPTSVGVVGGEGAAAVVLESREHAIQRGFTPLAQIVSYANCFAPSDAMTVGSPNGGRGSAKAITNSIAVAMRDAGLRPEDIGVVVSHACGDPDGDAAERAALDATLPGRPVVAPIASLGHAGAASGSLGLAVAVMAVAKRVVPPTIRVATTSRSVELKEDSIPLQGDHAISLSYTAEGCAIAIVVR